MIILPRIPSAMCPTGTRARAKAHRRAHPQWLRWNSFVNLAVTCVMTTANGAPATVSCAQSGITGFVAANLVAIDTADPVCMSKIASENLLSIQRQTIVRKMLTCWTEFDDSKGI